MLINDLLLKRLKAKRSSFMTLAEILHGIKKGVKKPTHLCYKTNVNHNVLKAMCQLLLEGQLITQQSSEVKGSNRHTYHITDKGGDWLRCYNCLIAVFIRNGK